MNKQIDLYNEINCVDEDDFSVDLRKIWLAFLYRKFFILKICLIVICIFITLTFFMPKKYTTEAALYINKTNNTNMMDINPFFMEDQSNMTFMNTNSALINELELIQSPLVLDKVIRENNLVYKKKYGFIPNKKEGEYISAEAFKKKNISFENKKGTNVIEISYKNKNKDMAYSIVNSIISNYIALHKELNSEKAKSDKKLIEKEYTKAKAQLDSKVKAVSGLPSSAMTNAGSLTAMSAFSASAQRAMSNIQGQYAAGEKSQLAVKEDAEKVAQLSSKLQWAKLVDEMSDSSKVLVLKEPQQLRDFEYSSPKLKINIILGIIFGLMISILAALYKELTDKNLTYTMLSDKVIYDLNKNFINLKTDLLANQNKKITFVLFENLPNELKSMLSEFNISYIKADFTSEFVHKVKNSDVLYNILSVNKTESKIYKQIKNLLTKIEIKNTTDVLIKE